MTRALGLVAALLLVAAAGCGASGNEASDLLTPTTTEVASGTLADGRRYALAIRGDGALCVQVDGGERLCAERSATWPVAVLEPAGGAAVAVAGLPSCVAAVRIEPGRVEAPTVVDDDVAYAVAGLLSEQKTFLVGLGRDGGELLRVGLVPGDVVAAPDAAC